MLELDSHRWTQPEMMTQDLSNKHRLKTRNNRDVNYSTKSQKHTPVRKCLCSQVCDSCRAREALLRWWSPAKPNRSEPSLSYSSRSGHTDNEHWERKAEQCQQMNCILNCVSAVCSHFSPQFLLLSLEAPSLARQAVWQWMQEPPAAMNTHSLNTFKQPQILLGLPST